MQVVLDTSTLIRFFTNDNPQKADKVEKMLLNEKNIVVPDVVFPELEYVLSSAYSTPRSKIIETYRFLITHASIKTSPYVKKALIIYESTSLDMADCIIASASFKGKLASFDKDLLQVKGIKQFWNSP